MANNTMGDRIAEQDAAVFQRLQEMMKKPGLYVGGPRFDYIEFLFSGYCWGRNSKVELLPSKELQYWLLHAQSASLHGSLSGASLFYRCFGARSIAFENYRAFLGTPLPSDLAGVDDELYAYEKRHDVVRYDWADDEPLAHNRKLAQAVDEHIRTLINGAGLHCDELKIYIRKERLFNQVRFLFRGSDEWMDDSQMIAKPECHNLLLAIHANTRNATAKNLRDCGYDVFDEEKYENKALSSRDAFTDEAAFLSEFARWKERQLKM